MIVKYYDREKDQMVELDVPSDCIDIKVPAQEQQPELTVVVNTDAVQVLKDDERVSMHEFTDLLIQ